MQKRNWRNWIVGSCVVILVFMMSAILVRVCIVQLVRYCGVSNSITDFVLDDYRPSAGKRGINWSEKYPFQTENMETGEATNDALLLFQNKVKAVEKKIGEWSSTNLWGYQHFIEMKAAYEHDLQWNLYRQEGAAIKILERGYLSHIYPRGNTKEQADSLINFYQFCQSQNIPFLFVQAPQKIDRAMERSRPELESFANRNADDIVDRLRIEQVPVLDIRDIIEQKKIDNLSLFFKTDHHWRPQTAMWAADLIARTLQERPDINLHYDPRLLSPESYGETVYYRNFLGSQGRVLTLSRVEPEDISLFFPKMETDFTYIIPDRSLHLRGDFSVMYDMKQVREGDCYHKNSYAAYSYGDEAFIHIHNHKQKINDKHVLLVKNSFGDAVEPFLAMAVAQMDVIDLRAFTGSLQTFIEQTHPDVIIVLYDPCVEGGEHINWSSHTDLFDFR